MVVLLASPDFLASDYIRRHELPYLVKAREQNDIKLTCLYLREANVDLYNIDVELDSGVQMSVNLTQYQGLNSPKQPIAAQTAADQDAMYAQAARELKAILEAPPLSRPLYGQRYSLTIQLQRRDPHLTRIYLHGYGRLYEHRALWRPPHTASPRATSCLKPCSGRMTLTNMCLKRCSTWIWRVPSAIRCGCGCTPMTRFWLIYLGRRQPGIAIRCATKAGRLN